MTDISDKVNWYIDIPVYKGNIYSYVKKFIDVVYQKGGGRIAITV